MNTVESGRFRLQLGFRVEATQLNTLGYIVTNDVNGNWISTAPAPANNWYWNPLPSAQLRYRITDDSDLRVSYGRGISRPNPYDTIPYVELDESKNPYCVRLRQPQSGSRARQQLRRFVRALLEAFRRNPGWFLLQAAERADLLHAEPAGDHRSICRIHQPAPSSMAATPGWQDLRLLTSSTWASCREG
jgi:hypothetical protein